MCRQLLRKPPTRGASTQALRLRLRCCPLVGAWDIGEQVAMLLREGDRSDKACAAGFYHLNARRLLAAGDRAGAKENVASAIAAFPECRGVMLLDHQLSADFF
jgi:hypothetical protein